MRLLHPRLQFWTELNTVFCYFFKFLIAASSSRPPSIGTEIFKYSESSLLDASVYQESTFFARPWIMGYGWRWWLFFWLSCAFSWNDSSCATSLRRATYERQWTHIWKPWWFWTLWGISELLRFSTTCGVYVEGNAEIAAAADFISRHILILGADSNHDVYIFAAQGLLAWVCLRISCRRKSRHHCSLPHNTALYSYSHNHPWCPPNKAKRARIEELRRQNENEAHLMRCARAEVIMRAKSLTVRARISLRKEENTNLTALELLSPPLSTVAPSNAAVSPAPLASIVEPTTDALSPSPSPSSVQRSILLKRQKKNILKLLSSIIQVRIRPLL